MAASESLSVPKLEDQALHSIIAIGRTRSPAEACGLLLIDDSSPDQRVIELANRSMRPQTSYEFTGDDAYIALTNNGVEDWNYVEVSVWHTHPGGSIGPSTEDIMQKLEGVPHLVVALLDDGTTMHEWF